MSQMFGVLRAKIRKDNALFAVCCNLSNPRLAWHHCVKLHDSGKFCYARWQAAPVSWCPGSSLACAFIVFGRRGDAGCVHLDGCFWVGLPQKGDVWVEDRDVRHTPNLRTARLNMS